MNAFRDTSTYPLGFYLTYVPKLLAQYSTTTLRLGDPNNVGELLYVKLISTDISGHFIQKDEPELVIGAIQEMLTKVQ